MKVNFNVSTFRFVERGNLEVLLFTLQSKMRANNQKPYLPKEEKTISDINRSWSRLEKAEHERELALREELVRYGLLNLMFMCCGYVVNGRGFLLDDIIIC